MFLKISSLSLTVIWRNVQILFFFYILCQWPWTFQYDLERFWATSPCLKENLISTTSISDERFRRYELGRMATTVTVCSTKFFFREHKNPDGKDFRKLVKLERNWLHHYIVDTKKSHAHAQCVHNICAKLEECQPGGARGSWLHKILK
jgi:hypothetical protein